MVPIGLWQNSVTSRISAELHGSSIFMTHLGCYIYEFNINGKTVYIPVFSEQEALPYSSNENHSDSLDISDDEIDYDILDSDGY